MSRVESDLQTTDKRRLRGEKSKRLIVDAAIACIAAQGLRHATLDQVARHASVSRALVVFHFKSKTGMLTAVLEHMHDIYWQGWEEALRIDGSVDRRLLSLLEFDLRFANERPDLLSAWHAFWGEARGSSLYRRVSYPNDQRYDRDLRRVLNELVEQGDYEGIDVAAVETGLAAMLFGLWRDVHILQDTADLELGMRAIKVYLRSVFPKHF